MLVDLIDLYSNLRKGALHPSKIETLLRRSLGPKTPKVVKTCIFELGRRLGPKKIASVRARYEAGESITKLAPEYGLSKSGLNTLLKRNGVILRYRRMTPEEIDQAAIRYAQGIPLSQLATEFEASQETIRKMLIRAGVVMRLPRRV